MNMIEELRRSGGKELHTYARNTSAGFFKKLGFISVSDKVLHHEAYLKYGIDVRLMKKRL